MAAISQAIGEQNAIGWDQILCSHLSCTWGDCYISCHHGDELHHHPCLLDHRVWTTRIICWAFAFLQELLDHCNCQTHTTSTDNPFTAKHLRLQLQVWAHYDRLHTLHLPLSQSDQDAFFRVNLEVFLLHPPAMLSAWITQVDRIFICHRKEINQRTICRLITFYFPRAQP